MKCRNVNVVLYSTPRTFTNVKEGLWEVCFPCSKLSKKKVQFIHINIEDNWKVLIILKNIFFVLIFKIMFKVLNLWLLIFHQVSWKIISSTESIYALMPNVYMIQLVFQVCVSMVFFNLAKLKNKRMTKISTKQSDNSYCVYSAINMMNIFNQILFDILT